MHLIRLDNNGYKHFCESLINDNDVSNKNY